VPITFTNHYKLFSDPEMLLGPARPGISRVYIHPAITLEKIESLGLTELMEECFNTINRPILEEHPHLR
jgi:1-acyl-sn-glycerol-3-phosphate acyltransferase